MSWYAVQTRSNYEAKVDHSLSCAGISRLYPTYAETVAWKRRPKRVVCRPLFPGYLFVDITLSCETRAAVASITGVFQLLGGRDPVEISAGEIQQVRLLMDSPALLRPIISYQPVQGEQVEVVAGNFSGVVGYVDRWKEKDAAITVWISSLGAGARLQVNAQDLRRCKVAQ